MIKDTLPLHTAQRFYDRIGKAYDWFEIFESRAKSRAQELLDLQPGHRLLNVGIGTGRQHYELQGAVLPGGSTYGVDISMEMVRLSRKLTSAAVCQADANHLPYSTASFDRLYAAYILDLLPLSAIPCVLAEFHRVIRLGGQVVLLSLTEGVDSASRLLVGLWKSSFRINPIICGGCRPLELSDFTLAAGFTIIYREVVSQLALPSEIVVAKRVNPHPNGK